MSSTMNGEEPPLKKKKPNSISSLPDDLIVSFLARVSRLHYPILSFVSKRFRSIIASPEIYQTRILLNRTEKCLYVCLQSPSDLTLRWFTLCKKPNQTLKKDMSSGYVLAPIRILNSPNVQWSNLIAVGSNLFAVTRAMEISPPCSNISFLDCRIHTWLEASSMRIAHTDSLFDGKLYLPGSNENPASLNCIEVFNTKTQAWNSVPPEKRIFKLKTMEGKICMNCNGLVCKPKELKWEVVGLDTKNFKGFSLFMVENIQYRFSSSEGFYWYYSKSDWRKLKGLEGLPKFDDGYSNVKLAEYGGKLMVLWDKYVPASGYEEEKMIWCAEISLEKRNNGEEIWGNVEWVDAVLTVPKSYEFVYAIAANV